MKRVLCLLIVMLLTMSALVSCDKDSSCELEYYSRGDGTCSVKGTNCQGEVVIPDISPNGEAVTHIWGFFECDGLQSVTIPASVTSINGGAFAGCPDLKSIMVAEDNPNYHSKNNCIIETESNTLIAGCKTSIIPDYVISIGESAFEGRVGLKNITIPASVTNIERYAFINCPDLNKIIVEEENPVYHSQDDCLIETETRILVLGCKKSEIPDDILKIGRGAFAGCTELKTVNIPNSVIEIGARAFENCSRLKKIHIPASVQNMYFGAFKGCSDLSSITVAEENTVFYSVEDCLIITSSGIMMFGCKNSKIPDSVTTIGTMAFSGCTGLKSVTIPNSVTEIGGDAFEGCTGLKEVTIPDSVIEISSGAFEGCAGLKEVAIPNSVTSIGGGAFSGCTGLKSITIPNSVTEIGYEAFTNCTGIIEVKDGVHLVDGWIVGYDETVSSVSLSEIRGIGQYAFQHCVGLTDMVLSGSFTTIGDFQFDGCTNLTEITLPQGITSIGQAAFIHCSSLEQIDIPEGVAYIGKSAFSGCSALRQITIPGSVTSLGEHMFTDCMSLKNIYYTGTEEQWASYNISPVASNDGLARATIHYNYVPEE